MVLSKLIFMVARVIATNRVVRKEASKAAQKSMEKAKPYIEKASKSVKKVAEEAAIKSPPEKDIFKFMGSVVAGFKNKDKI